MAPPDRDRHGDDRPSGLILTPPDPVEAERLAHREFGTTYAAELYRPRLARLHAEWDGFNRAHFGGRLTPPHISIGRTAPRRFSQCRLTTNYGGQIDITLSERVVFAADRQLVRREYPAPGYVRFEDDLLLGEVVKQFVLELEGYTEEGYGGYGPRYAAHATRIGETLGLPEVPARRRGHHGSGQPVAAFWPWAFRPAGYYLGDVRLDGRQVAGLHTRPPDRRAALPGLYEYLLYLLVTGRGDRLRELLERQVDADRVVRSPPLAAFERGPADADGRPLPVPPIRPDWVVWNDACVRRMAEHVLTRRAFDAMPILADALEDAGCDDRAVLDHCRAASGHTHRCWVLRALIDASV